MASNTTVSRYLGTSRSKMTSASGSRRYSLGRVAGTRSSLHSRMFVTGRNGSNVGSKRTIDAKRV
jgi:hypothetical protein